MLRLAVLALGATGCLFAPPRPADTNDGVVDAAVDGLLDGTTDGTPACTVQALTLGPAVAVPSSSGDVDAVLRLGITGTSFKPAIFVYTGDVRGTACPANAFLLTTGLTGIPLPLALVPIDVGSDHHIFAMLAPPGTTPAVEVHDLSFDGLNVFDSGHITAPFRPGPAMVDGTTDDLDTATAFVGFVPNPGQLWFGGGNQVGVVPYDGISPLPSGAAPLTINIAGESTYYNAIGTTAADHHALLVGGAATYEAGASGAMIGGDPTGDGIHGACNPSTSCFARVARTLSHPTSFFTAVSAARRETAPYLELELAKRDGTVVTSDLVSPTLPSSAYVLDLDLIMDVSGPLLAVLWASGTADPPVLALHQAPTGANPIADAEPLAMAPNAERILFVNSAAGLRLLALPHVPTDPGACFVVTAPNLTPCP